MDKTETIPARILVVDDEEDILLAARLLLKRHFSAVETLSNPAGLTQRIRAGSFDVVMLDMNFVRGADSGAEGLQLLGDILAIDPNATVVMVTAHADMDLAIRAMKLGAADFVVKPWENGRLIATLTAAVNLRRARQETAELKARQRALASADAGPGTMIGTSAPMRHVFELIRKAAPTDANVLILGENGTGKELVAREIHRQSRRADEMFVRVDLGTLSPTLFESELFGHRRGAFTDAREDRIGRFRAAAGGTLFLDEIGNVPLHLQSRLLTALERREIVPVGGDKAEPIDVRLICATNLTAAQRNDENVFRQDLLYRINTVEIDLPPLRNRPDDIPFLVEHFTTLYAHKYNMAKKRITAAALDRLCAYAWPGNVRALSHAVERAIILSEGDTLDVVDFSLPPTARPEAASTTVLDLEKVELETITRALSQYQGNITRAAKALGLTRGSLYRRMGKYGL